MTNFNVQNTTQETIDCRPVGPLLGPGDSTVVSQVVRDRMANDPFCGSQERKRRIEVSVDGIPRSAEDVQRMKKDDVLELLECHTDMDPEALSELKVAELRDMLVEAMFANL